jgi:hypothetical protein
VQNHPSLLSGQDCYDDYGEAMQGAPLTVGRSVVILLLLLLLGLTLAGAIYYWQSFTGSPISLAGKIAMVIGICVALALGFGLMALSFYSARSGRDADAQYQPHKKRDDI